jgi:cytochrome oxidase Cu insertion factor (SCO1/SenC/PrrC family)
MPEDTGSTRIRATLFFWFLEVQMLKFLSVCAGLGVAVWAVALSAQGQPEQNPAELKVGDVAPAFALPGSDGKIHQLSDSKGKTLVLAWFPKAFTGG